MVLSAKKNDKEIVLHNAVWVLLADRERAKLCRCGLTKNARCHVEIHEVLENGWPGHDHPKSSPQWKNATVSYGIEEDDWQEDSKRFVREITDWLDRRMKQHAITHLVTVMPPRLAGVFRKTKFAQSHTQNVIQYRGDLVNMPAAKLAEHAVIQGLVTGDTNEA
ncbi:host attachment protein [Planctomycetota bacterium]